MGWGEVNGFINTYHKQGKGKPTEINIGLWYGEELVGISTFAPIRYKRKDIEVDWEWMRLCYKEDVIVKGGTYRLLETFREYYPGHIISYQFDEFGGEMFSGLGFKHIGSNRSKVYIHEVTGKTTRHRFINDLRNEKLQVYLGENSEHTVAGFFGYRESREDMVCHVWYKEYEPIGYIYKISSPEGRYYIGQKRQTVFEDSYWSSSQNKDYWADLERFGKDSFKREVLEWCYTVKELNKKERHYIETSDALVSKGGYNICVCFPNIERTDEVSRKLKEASDLYWSNPKNREYHGRCVKDSIKYQESRKVVGDKIRQGKINSPHHNKEGIYAFTQTDEFRAKQSKLARNKRWYNNGINQIYIPDCPPDGYVAGMLPSPLKGMVKTEDHRKALSESKKGKVWWNDGINIKSGECPGEGWVRGRIGKSLGKQSRRSTAFNPNKTNEEMQLLCATNSLSKLAEMFATTVPTIRGYLKYNGIVKGKSIKPKV